MQNIATTTIETKYRARERDIPKVLNKANAFRLNFPQFGNHKAYLGYATLAFDGAVERACVDNGIAIIKQIGDTVVIDDGHVVSR